MSPSRSNWPVIAYGLALAFFAAYQQFKLPPALPVLLEAYDYDRTLAGGFMSVYAVAGLALSLLFGRVLTRRGAALPTLIALALLLTGNISMLWRPEDGWTVLAGRGLEGVGFSVLAIAGPLLANAHAAAGHLPIVVALTAAWIPIGQLAATAAAPAAFATVGWTGLWWLAIAATLGLALWTWRLRRRDALEPSGPMPVGESPPMGGYPVGQRLKLTLAGAVFMLWACQYFAYMTWLPQYLVEAQDLTVDWAVAGYVIPVAVLLVSILVVGAVLRAGVPVGPLLAGGLAAQTAVWWTIPQDGDLLPGLLSLVVYGAGAGICPTCLFAMPSVIVGQGRRAAHAFAIIMTGRNVGVLVGPVLLAQAFEQLDSWDVAGPIFGSITAAALGLGAVLALALRGARYGTRR